MLQLESKTARRHVLRLMHALEREALAIFKVARRLEDPDVTPKDYDKLRAHHARSAIVDRLREDFAEKHVALAHLDDLYEWIGLLSKHWYRQGGMILDRVEALRGRRLSPPDPALPGGPGLREPAVVGHALEDLIGRGADPALPLERPGGANSWASSPFRGTSTTEHDEMIPPS